MLLYEWINCLGNDMKWTVAVFLNLKLPSIINFRKLIQFKIFIGWLQIGEALPQKAKPSLKKVIWNAIFWNLKPCILSTILTISACAYTYAILTPKSINNIYLGISFIPTSLYLLICLP